MKISSFGANLRPSELDKQSQLAATTRNSEFMLQIAENSNKRSVLLGLIRNRELKNNEEVVQALFSRDIPYVTRNLENLGYESNSIF